ncbi:MAG: hypothetical protein ACYSTF_04750 [Planctomycetota bacterium]|jgi:hypothetical protein
MRLLAIVICLLTTGCGSPSNVTDGEREVTKVIRHGNYVIKTQNWPSLADSVDGKPAEGILTVKHDKYSRTLAKTGAQYYFEECLDLTGDSEEDLVFQSWTGGAHGACELIVFDSKINKFNIFYYGHQLGTKNEHLRTLFPGDIPYTFKDMDDDGVPEILILHQWAYYGSSFAFSPQYLKIYSLRNSNVSDITEKSADFISRVVGEEEAVFEKYRKKGGMTDDFHAMNVSVLLMKLYGGLEADTAWRRYDTVRREIGHGDRYTREHIEKSMTKYNEAFEPYTK